MHEGKSIVSLVISVLVAIIMLGMFAYVITVNTRIWDGFSRQNQASSALREYAEYAAYDDTKCRGQDLLSLAVKTNGDPFLLIYDQGGSYLIGECTDVYTKDLEVSDLDLAGVTQTWSWGSSNLDDYVSTTSGVKHLKDWTADAMQDFFLKGNGAAGYVGNIQEGHYASYKTYLVYEDKSSSTIVGIVAIKE